MAWDVDLGAQARQQFDEVPWNRLVGIGDSIMEGELGDPVDGYPDRGWFYQVADALQAVRPDLEYRNFGKRFLKTKQILETQLPPALEFEPDVAIVMTGGNDLLVEKWDERLSEQNIDALLGPLVERGATVFVSTMLDIFKTDLMPVEHTQLLRERFYRLNDIVREVAARNGCPLLDFSEHPACDDKTIYASDLQHANRRGHALAAQWALGEIAEHLAKVGAGR